MRYLTTIAWLLCLATTSASEPTFRVTEIADDPAPSFAAFQEELNDVAPAPPSDDLVYFGGPSNRWWVRGEYLLWWTDGLRTPPLVSTSADKTVQAAAGVLDQGATTLFGGDLLTNSRSGGRIRFGTWLNECRRFGVEGEYFALGDINANFAASSTGSPILARPFFNALSNAEDSELIAFPGVVSGTVDANAQGSLQSAGARLLWNLCQSGDPIELCSIERSEARLDLLLGYRFLRLDDSLQMREQLTSQLANEPGTFDINDSFVTRNEFHGGEVGLSRTESYRRWTLDMLFKIAFGNVRESVSINGNTIIDDGTGPEAFTGGLLAQRTNSGDFTRDRFALIPELGVTIGYQLTPRWQANFGYSLIYWDRVVRAGEQIDRTVNPNLGSRDELRPDVRLVTTCSTWVVYRAWSASVVRSGGNNYTAASLIVRRCL
ncbi:MAG: BBP7 family outer membrane beta-barrel protein [Planctomycetia bacterium]|nr:BBP7 family outer membrane beta-barrel protein [Planctomycetia bacterium]